jgi:hypothetical protein
VKETASNRKILTVPTYLHVETLSESKMCIEIIDAHREEGKKGVRVKLKKNSKQQLLRGLPAVIIFCKLLPKICQKLQRPPP